MFRRTAFIASTLATLLFASAPAMAAPLSITFETFPGADGVLGTADDVPSFDGDIVPMTNEYASIGLTFSQGTLVKDDFFDGNPVNHYISSTNPIATLSVPVYGISIESLSFWDATLRAYGVGGQLLDSFTLFNPSAGADLVRGTLALTTNERIYSFSVLPNDPNYILNLDNLVLNLDAAVVPEPSQLLMFPLALGLLAAARARTRARRKN